jgi:hypothetical protein
MCLVACGDMGLGDWIWEMESGLPFGMSTLRAEESRRDSRRDEDEWCERELDDGLDEEEELDLDDRDEDFS